MSPKKKTIEKEKNILEKSLTFIYMFQPEESVRMAESFGFLSADEVHAYSVALLGTYATRSKNNIPDLLKQVPEAKEYLDDYDSFGYYKEQYAGLFFRGDKLGTYIQRDISSCGGNFTNFALARYPYVAPEILSMLSRENNEALWVRIIQNKNTSANVLAQLSFKKSDKVQKALEDLILSGKLSGKTIETLFRFGSEKMMRILAKANIRPSLLQEVMKTSSDEALISNIINNPNVPLELLNEYYDTPELREQIQLSLMKRKDGMTLLEEKINPGMPMSLLTAIAGAEGLSSKGAQKLIGLNCYTVLNALNNNKSLPEGIRQSVEQELDEFEIER